MSAPLGVTAVQRDPRCSPQCPAPSRKEPSPAVHDVHRVSCRTVPRKAQKRECALCTGRLLISQNQNALPRFLPVTRERRSVERSGSLGATYLSLRPLIMMAIAPTDRAARVRRHAEHITATLRPRPSFEAGVKTHVKKHAQGDRMCIPHRPNARVEALSRSNQARDDVFFCASRRVFR